MVKVKALGLPHVLEILLGASNIMLPVKYLRSNKAFFVSTISQISQHCHKVKVNLATLSFGDITRFKTWCVFVYDISYRQMGEI